MVPGLSSTLPKATLYAFLPIQITWKFKKLGENQNPIQDFVNKVKDVNKISQILVKASRLEVKTYENFLIQKEKYNIRGK